MTNVLGKKLGLTVVLVLTHCARLGIFLLYCLKTMPPSQMLNNFPSLLLSFILTTARHKSIQNAKTYAQDSASLLCLVLVQDKRNPEYHLVSKWDAIDCIVASAVSVTLTLRPYQKPLSELTMVLSKCLLAITRAIEFVTGFKPKLGVKDAVVKMEMQSCPPEVAAAINELYDKAIQETACAVSSRIVPAPQVTSPPSSIPTDQSKSNNPNRPKQEQQEEAG
jgi:hypothetical protein